VNFSSCSVAGYCKGPTACRSCNSNPGLWAISPAWDCACAPDDINGSTSLRWQCPSEPVCTVGLGTFTDDQCTAPSVRDAATEDSGGSGTGGQVGGGAGAGGSGGGSGGTGGGGALGSGGIPGTDGGMTCSPACTSGLICVASGTEGGAIINANDAGVCPSGMHPTGFENRCENNLAYGCMPIPGACGGTVTCTCAAVLCNAPEICIGPTNGVLSCILEAP
jgi:hypothetical protein